MRIGRLILGSAVLGAVGTFVYSRTSSDNKNTLLGYVKKAVDWLPSSIKGYIPTTILDKLSGNVAGGTVSSDHVGDVSRSAGPQSHTESGSQRGTTGTL